MIKLFFSLWIATVVGCALILGYFAPVWNGLGLLFLFVDVLFGIFFFILFNLRSGKLLHVRFRGIKGTLFSLIVFVSSLGFGIAILCGIFVIHTRLFLHETVLPLRVNVPLFSAQKNTTKNAKATILNTPLKSGSTGEEVQLLQVLLAQDISLYSSPITGYYGTMTVNAVTKFQQKYNLNQTGEADAKTINKLAEIYGTHPRSYWVSLIPKTTQQNQTSPTQNTQDESEWGKSERVTGTQYGWTMRVGMDAVMATPKEIFDALNAYRITKGVHGLNWDGNLATFAQERANYLNSIGSTDDHAGFESYVNDEENRKHLGFLGLGENASYGFTLSGVHIIEWMYAGDAPHDANQLKPEWTDVGIGVSNTATSIIFGYNRF